MAAPARPRAPHPPVPLFEVGDERSARRPPEARGLARDQVRLLAAVGGRVEHARFRDLPRYLRPGDLLVVNNSKTLAAAVDGARADGRPVVVHFSTALDDGAWAVEVRPPGAATGPVDDVTAGERIRLPAGAALSLLAPYGWNGDGPVRLWRGQLNGVAAEALFATHGLPITYAYLEGRWPLPFFQTVFARHAGSAEMPSAARPFTDRLVTELVSAGVAIAPVTLHAGVSSLEPGEAPLPERFRVPHATAALVNATRAAGGRVVAVGTTTVRALESVAALDGAVAPGGGWTELVLGPERPARVVDGLVTGWHAPGGSHLALLEAVVGGAPVGRSYESALEEGYLWHEFGDSNLLLPA